MAADRTAGSMIRVVPPSTVPHPWIGAWGLVAAAIVWAVLLYLLIQAATWLVLQTPSPDWSFVPITG